MVTEKDFSYDDMIQFARDVQNLSGIQDQLYRFYRGQSIELGKVEDYKDISPNLVGYAVFKAFYSEALKFLENYYLSRFEVRNLDHFEKWKNVMENLESLRGIVYKYVNHFKIKFNELGDRPSDDAMRNFLDEVLTGSVFNEIISPIHNQLDAFFVLLLGTVQSFSEKNHYQISVVSTYLEGVVRFVRKDGVALFGTPSQTLAYMSSGGKKGSYWTCAALVYSVESRRVKLVLSRDKKVNRLLDSDFVKNANGIFELDSDFDLIKGEGVQEFQWTNRVGLELKPAILESNKRTNIELYIFKPGEIARSQWVPIRVSRSSSIVCNLDFSRLNDSNINFVLANPFFKIKN